MATETVADDANTVELGKLIKLRHFLGNVPVLADGAADSGASKASDDSWDESHWALLEENNKSLDNAQSEQSTPPTQLASCLAKARRRLDA